MARHEIQILRAVSMAQAAVANKTGVSVQSVRRIERETPVTTSDVAALRKARGIGRPSQRTSWTTHLEAWLTEDPALPGVEAAAPGAGGRLRRRQECAVRFDVREKWTAYAQQE